MRRLSCLLLLLLLLSGEDYTPVYAGIDLTLHTFCETSVGGALPAAGGECFSVTAEPVKGRLILAEDGSFVYTPRPGKQGRDNFRCAILDASGQQQREFGVDVWISRESNAVPYTDLQDRPEAYAAALLCEKGLFTGEQIAGKYCFCPEKSVTRGEFLAICMTLSGKPMLSAVSATGCPDDAAIPAWAKTYVQSAALTGVDLLRGEGFQANLPITRSEASRMAEQILGGVYTLEGDAALNRADMALLLAADLEG